MIVKMVSIQVIQVQIDLEKAAWIGIFLDLSRAFHALDYNRLMKQLEWYGIRGKDLDWLHIYPSNHKICVKHNNVHFEKQPDSYTTTEQPQQTKLHWPVFKGTEWHSL